MRVQCEGILPDGRRCPEIIGERRSGILIVRHSGREFESPRRVTCQRGHVWYAPDAALSDQMVTALRQYLSRPTAELT